MSQRRQQTPAPPDHAAAPKAAQVSAAGHRWSLLMIVVVATVWWILLGTLAFITANPVTLNRAQIRHAPVLVTGVVDDLAGGKVRVEKHWRGAENTEAMTIENLRATGARGGEAYLFPLEPTERGRLRVVPAPLPNHQPLIYPAGAEAERQLKEILESPADLQPQTQTPAGSKT